MHVFTFHQNESVQVERDHGVLVHRLPAAGYITKSWGRAPKAMLRASLQLATYLSAVPKFDVYDFSQFPYLPAILCKVSPLLITWLEVWSGIPSPHKDPIISASSRILERIAARKANFNIAISELTRRALIANLKIDPKNVTTVPCGVDLDEIRSIRTKKDPNRIAYVGRFAPHKGLDMVLNAWKIVSNENPNVRLTLFTVPDDSEFDTVEAKAQAFDRLSVRRGPRREALETLKSSSIFVSASRREGFRPSCFGSNGM